MWVGFSTPIHILYAEAKLQIQSKSAVSVLHLMRLEKLVDNPYAIYGRYLYGRTYDHAKL